MNNDEGVSVEQNSYADLTVETIPCDLCGADETDPQYVLRDTLHGVPGSFVLCRCSVCGLMYLNPRPTPKSMLAFYPPQYVCYRGPIEAERLAPMRWIRRCKLISRRRLIEKHSSRKQGALLDVGCATGVFLHEMARAGWQVAGVEPVESAADRAREWFDLDVFSGSLHTAPFEPGSFDVVTFWDVLEHTYSPVEELSHACSLLRPGGLLVLSIPNWHSLDRRLFKAYWQGLDAPRHLYVFTRQVLTTMLVRTGFVPMNWICFMSGYFSFVMSLERWLKARSPLCSRIVSYVASVPGLRFLFEPWFVISNWLKIGDVITVFARKAAPGDNQAH